jgi:homoserine dehydrogenase
VQVRTALAGTLTWHGAGAGGRSTASALLADTIAAARTLNGASHR